MRESLLPRKFFFDGDRIASIAQGKLSDQGDSSFGNVAALYRLFGLASEPLLASIAGYLVFTVTVILAARRMRNITPPLAVSLLVAPILFFGSVYLGFYSKDVFALVIVLALLLAGQRLSGDALILTAMTAYAFVFRQYWFLVVIAYVTFRMLTWRVRSPARILITSLVVLLAFSLGIFLALGQMPDHFRLIVNENRTDGVEVNTLIQPFISGDNFWAGTGNVLLTFLALIVPIPLAFKGGAYYIALAIVIGGMWVVILGHLEPKRLHNPLRGARETLIHRSVIVLAAFLCTQALFEPDYGSALRHLTPLMPLMLVVVWGNSSGILESEGPLGTPTRIKTKLSQVTRP
jgi:hypothetical protein